MGGATPIVVARDLVRNLAAAVDLEEGVTNANVRLEPALTLAGRITDLNGKAITNGQVQATSIRIGGVLSWARRSVPTPKAALRSKGCRWAAGIA